MKVDIKGFSGLDMLKDRDMWHTFVRTVMILWFAKMWEISWLYDQLLASQGGLCCMELVGWLVG